jgi:hypothetical protein
LFLFTFAPGTTAPQERGMVTNPGAAEEFSIERVLSRGIGAITGNLAVFTIVALVLAGPPMFLVQWWSEARVQINVQTGEISVWSFIVAMLLALLVNAVTNAVLQAALTRATVQHLSGEKPNIAACLSVGIAMLLPMIGLGLLQGLGLTLGFILQIVPGIILTVMWSVVVPVYVQERPGVIESFSRSAELTSGERWKIFALLILVGIAMWIIQYVGQKVAVAFASSGPLVPALILAAVSALTSMIWLTIAASIYVELRDVKDGVGPSELEAIFS